jgi:hypothetical protein
MGVEPGIYRTVLLPSGTVAARGPGTADIGPAGSIGNLLASMPGVSPVTHDGPGRALPGSRAASGSGGRSGLSSQPEFERAMGRLDELLQKLPPFPGRNDIASLLGLGAQRTMLVSLASAPHDRQIIELMARIFDTMLSDPHVPPPFVSTLARLQSSALRVALNEPEMFTSIKHATWRLIDRIGEAAYAYPQVNDPRAFALLAACRALVDQLASTSKPDSGLYRRALTQLDAFLDAQRQVQRDSAEPVVQSLQRAERRDQLDRLLRQRLVDQMVDVRTTPLVRRFVTSVWSQVLAEAMLVHGEQGDVTRSYIKLVDELLWSLQLPDHPRSRQRLLALLPDLLKRLRAGMASISMPVVDQQLLLDDLMAIHTEALRPGTRNDANDLTPEQIVQRMRDEVMPASTGNGGFGDSVIDLSSLETVPAAMLPSEGGGPGDDPIDRVAALVPGQRLRLFLQVRWSRVQLLWRSDQAMFFLFAGENAERTHSVTRRALERLAGAGLMQAFEARPLVQRTLDAVTRGFVRPP